MSQLVDLLAARGRTALTADRPRPFEAAIERFRETLATIPDYPAAELSDGGFARVIAIAEQVLSQIEHRLETGGFDASRRERLAASVYEIRRGLEEAFRWRKHYLKGD